VCIRAFMRTPMHMCSRARAHTHMLAQTSYFDMIISADPMPLYLCRCAAPPTPCALSATMRALTCTKHFWKKSLSRNPSTHKRQTPYHRKHSPKSHLISPVSPQFLTGFSPGSQPEFHRHTRISPDLPGFSPVSHRFLTARQNIT
jgi:hypothetical protein